MPLYQVSFFDRRGRLSHLRELECASDDAAIQLMAQHRHEHGIEIWRGRDLVWTFDPRSRRSGGLARVLGMLPLRRRGSDTRKPGDNAPGSLRLP